MITYKREKEGLWNVLLDGKKIGQIKKLPEGGWQYFPKGSKTGGEILSTLTEVQLSLEQE